MCCDRIGYGVLAICFAQHSLLVVGRGFWHQSFSTFRCQKHFNYFFALRFAQCKKIRQPSRATAAGRHAPFPVSYTIRLPAGSICARNIIPWFCPLRKYKKSTRPNPHTFLCFFRRFLSFVPFLQLFLKSFSQNRFLFPIQKLRPLPRCVPCSAEFTKNLDNISSLLSLGYGTLLSY